ncbi:MAG: T9SS type A sorting domain-containing protein [Flavobacteriales bacterium]|nr:T9SS type A sorting domain-containing protein [Flavobacteriales bacterium]MCX7768119.1 T9SS type A sorting domain-containing protein [Flavobacteriales bacterium]MDW8409589.1 choice-of-anchor J domain-containing protein [Flavobacteriales bacterium]
MKKNFILFLVLAEGLFSPFTKAQNDTLLYMDFNNDPSPYFSPDFYPPGNPYDTAWYNIDLDMLTPVGQNNGVGPAWFWSLAFADADTLQFVNVFAARSWFEEIGQAKNYLITPAIPIVDANAVLHWRSAPYQTPRYLDGYKVLISSTTNDIEAFTDTVFVAAEMTQLAPPNDTSGNFAAYQFSSGFIHGLDGQYVEDQGDPMRLRGMLRPFSISLAPYAGKFIFVAFYHDSYDDNFISVDEILVTGTYDPNFGLNKTDIPHLQVKLFPNPVHHLFSLDLSADKALDGLELEIVDITGKTLHSEDLGKVQGALRKQISAAHLSTGLYALRIKYQGHSTTLKFQKL